MKRALALLLAAFVVANVAIACGRVMEPPVCLDWRLDTVWGTTPTRPDSVAVLVGVCRRWE